MLENKNSYTIDGSKALDPEVQRKLIAEIDSQIREKKSQLAMRFK